MRPRTTGLPLRVDGDVDDVAEPERLPLSPTGPVLQVEIVAGGGDGGSERRGHPRAVVRDDVVAPSLRQRLRRIRLLSEDQGRPSRQERERERLRLGLPEDRVERLRELVEPLELAHVPRAAQGERGDLGDPPRQVAVAFGEGALDVGRQDHQRPELVRLPRHRRDERRRRLVDEPELGRDLLGHVAFDHEWLIERREEAAREIGGDRGGGRSRERPSMMGRDEVPGLLVATIGDDGRPVDDRRHGGDDTREHAGDVPGAAERLRQTEQRRRRLRRFAFLLQQAGVLVGDGCVRGEDLEHPLVILVELIGPQVREHDDAGHLVSDLEGYGQERFVDLVGALDLHAPIVVEGVGRVVRLPGDRGVAGDALADLRDQLLGRLGLVLGELSAKGDRPQREAVLEQEVDPAVVIVDQRLELGRDGLADRGDVVQRVQPRRQGVQHPQLRHGAQLVLVDGSAHAVAGLDHPGGPGRGPSHPLMTRPVRALPEAAGRGPVRARVPCAT